MFKDVLSEFRKIFTIEEPPYDYDFIMNLDEKEYPKYLKKIFKISTGFDLNLKNPKTFNEKVQWLKLYDNLPIKTTLTDKLLVRDWVKERIGDFYLKPILGVYEKFDDIVFDELPSTFYIKTNHGCKWHFHIKNKDAFLNNRDLYNVVKNKIDGWMSQSFFGWSVFETQYKNIAPKLFVEKSMIEKESRNPVEIEAFCFDGEVRLIRKVRFGDPDSQSFYTNELKLISEPIPPFEEEESRFIEDVLHLSKNLADSFKLVRIDWLVFDDRPYFNEMTFTPCSGMVNLEDKFFEGILNKYLKI